MQTYKEGWRLGHLTLVTRSSKSTSRPCQSCQITHFIPIWGWSISAGPARLHYPQTSCEMAIMCVQACGGNGPPWPSAFTSQQWASYMGLNILLRPLNTNTLKQHLLTAKERGTKARHDSSCWWCWWLNSTRCKECNMSVIWLVILWLLNA